MNGQDKFVVSQFIFLRRVLEMGRFWSLGTSIAILNAIGVSTVMSVSSLAWVAPSSIAQSCYMVTASGKKVALGTLCGEVPPEPTPTEPAAGQAPGPAKNGIYRVPIKRRLASTPVIDVSFNGKTFEMILDTGASSTLITKRMSDRLGLKPTGVRNMIIADGSRVRFPMATVGTVSAGGLTARQLVVTVANNSDIGLLGHDFFGKYDVKIKRNVIEFQPQTE
jgi:predicted aspartyl protease